MVASPSVVLEPCGSVLPSGSTQTRRLRGSTECPESAGAGAQLQRCSVRRVASKDTVHVLHTLVLVLKVHGTHHNLLAAASQATKGEYVDGGAALVSTFLCT